MDFKKYSNGSWSDTPVYKYNKTAAGAPNLVINNITPKTINGLTFTVSGESIAVNGKATTNTNIYLKTSGSELSSQTYQKLGKGKYVIGGNPDDAAANYFIISMRYKSTESGTSNILRFPVGETLEIDNRSGNYNFVAIYLAIWNAQTCDNVVFAPFIKPIADSWYGIEAYRRESGSWTDTPSFGKRKRKAKPIVEKVDDM